MFLQLPNLVQDICRLCHPYRYGPNVPRFNIYRSGSPRTIVPVFLEDWF
jgi:hypothetical protein